MFDFLFNKAKTGEINDELDAMLKGAEHQERGQFARENTATQLAERFEGSWEVTFMQKVPYGEIQGIFAAIDGNPKKGMLIVPRKGCSVKVFWRNGKIYRVCNA